MTLGFTLQEVENIKEISDSEKKNRRDRCQIEMSEQKRLWILWADLDIIKQWGFQKGFGYKNHYPLFSC